ncbi:hypothetical protein [Stenotrophomonas sepilia]|uniref:hypothetical protein n=1 Tax=Stenotrophomonas sepilia TaxID=2860290 RepID=UPI002E763475|nr:hypothetical protein [Stenotrophomonas sepilia]
MNALTTVRVADFVGAQIELNKYAAAPTPITIVWKVESLMLSQKDEQDLFAIHKQITQLQKAGHGIEIRQDAGVYAIIAT